MRYERLSGLFVGPLGRSLLGELDKTILDCLAGLRRRIESELQNRRRQRADGRGEQGIPFDKLRICA